MLNFSNERFVLLVRLIFLTSLISISSILFASEKFNQASTLLNEGKYQASYELLDELVTQNDALAMLLMGNFYEYGYLGRIDSVQACDLYKKSALQNIPVALDKAAYCLLNNKNANSIKTDDKELAIDYYKKAAESGHHISLCNLADYYYIGNKLPQDIPQAISLCEQSALQGSPPAMLKLAKMHLKAPELQRNIDQAIKWFTLAAEYKMPEAYFYVGHFFEEGLGAEKDIQSALIWYEKAAAAGYHLAYLPTAKIYFDAPRQAKTGKWQEAALAKAYLWLSASMRVNPNDSDTISMFATVKTETPPAWQKSLDEQVSVHFAKFP